MKLPLLGTFTVGLLCPLVSGQVIELSASDITEGVFFGYSVAISSPVAIVGAPHGGNGSAYLFDTATGAELAKLLGNGGSGFGNAVAIHGTTAIVGEQDSASIFNATTGTQIATLVSQDHVPGDSFGSAVAVHGTIAIVGAPSIASAYLFDTTTGAQIAKLVANDASGGPFGRSVDISGNIAVIGAGGDNSAYVFDATTGAQLAKLIPNDGNASFGFSVGISGTTAIIGAPSDGQIAGGAGAAYLFNATTGAQIGRLLASNGLYGDYLGWSVDISGNIGIAGAPNAAGTSGTFAPGSAYLFSATTGTQLTEFPNLATSTGQFGYSVAFSSNTAIIGVPYSDKNGQNSGTAYLINIDCDNNGAFDFEQIANDPMLDCDQTGFLDSCEMITFNRDCNSNDLYDPCECLGDPTADCNTNLIPDICEGLPDCNSNGIPDECDSQEDCDNNGLLDHCEIESDGSLDLNDNDILDSCECPPVTNYCIASPNSVSATGAPISLDGLPSLSVNSMTLRTKNLRPNQFGVFFYGLLEQDPPVSFGSGYRCVASTGLTRLNPAVHTGTGTAQRVLDMTATPLSSIQAGDTRYFQFWYRDPVPVGDNYNLTDGLEVTFCP